MKTWVKLYTEILDDPDIGSLPWEQRGIFMALLALAGKIDHRDDDDMETGRLDTIERVAWQLRCSVESLRDAVAVFVECGFLDDRDGILYVTHYPDRQAHSPSEDRNAVTERVKRYRERKAQQANTGVTSLQTACNEGVTPLQAQCNDPVTHLEKKREDKNRAEEKREDTSVAAQKTAPPPTPAPTPHLDILTPAERKRYKLPSGPEPSDAVKSWLQIAHAAGRTLSPNELMTKRIDAVVLPDQVPRWREVCESWATRGYSMVNVDGLLDVFKNGWDRPNGGASSSVTKRRWKSISDYSDDEIKAAREAEKGMIWQRPEG